MQASENTPGNQSGATLLFGRMDGPLQRLKSSTLLMMIRVDAVPNFRRHGEFLFDSPAIRSSIAMSWYLVEVELLTNGQKKDRIYHCCCTNTNHSGMPVPTTSTVFPEGKAISAPICPVVLRCGQKAGLHRSIATI